MNKMKVSIVIPVYNEALLISEILRRVCNAPLPEGAEREVVIVDDGSTDATVKAVEEFLLEHPSHRSFFRVHTGLINHGKGAALRAGFTLATGDVIIIQDGDLEYTPSDYITLLTPFLNSKTHIVYGSRFMNGFPKGMKWLNLSANLALSWATRILYQQRITDEATGYKVFRKTVLNKIHLKSRGFEFCPEFTGKALLSGYHITEVPIHYNPRGILDGKKIRARDGFIAMWWLAKIRLKAPPLVRAGSRFRAANKTEI